LLTYVFYKFNNLLLIFDGNFKPAYKILTHRSGLSWCVVVCC